MEVSVSLSCLFVHEPPPNYSGVLQFHFHHGSSSMDHPTVFTHFPRKSGARSGPPQSTAPLILMYNMLLTHTGMCPEFNNK